jgi:hypothetical protein
MLTISFACLSTTVFDFCFCFYLEFYILKIEIDEEERGSKRRGEVAQAIYIRLNKCINNKKI